MSRSLAHPRASLVRPAAALGVLSLAALGVVSPAMAQVDDVRPELSDVQEADPGGTGDTGELTEGATSDGGTPDPSAEASLDGEATDLSADPDGEAADGDVTGQVAAETDERVDASAEGEGFSALVVEEDGTVTLDILAITDFHGALEQAPALAQMIEDVRAENPDTAFVSVGDNIGGSTFESMIQQDNPTIEVLNAMDLEASAVGNHEFDRGYDDLAARIAGTDPGLVQAEFPYLGANVQGEDPDLPGYHIWTTAGVDVAFVGAVTTTTSQKVSPEGIAGITFTDEAQAVNEVAAQLSDDDETNGEADIVVALVHAAATDSLTTAMSDDVDALFTGDSHLEVNTMVGDMPVLQTVNSGEQLARLTLSYDPQTGEVSTVDQTILPVDSETAITAVRAQDVQAIVDAAFTAAEELGREQVGTITAQFNRGTNDGETTGSNRGTESTLGNLVAEVYQWQAHEIGQEADFGVVNPGGLRADLDQNRDGIITYAEVATVSPFGNTVTIVDLTGEQVVQMLEEQWLRDPGEDHPVLRLGLSDEVAYYYDPTAPAGEKVLDIEIDGEPIDLGATYSVATINFLAQGGDGFEAFTLASNVNDTGLVDREALKGYLQAHPELSPDYSQRSIGVTAVTDLDQEFFGGEEVIIDLASLSFTSNEPKPEQVILMVNGEETDTFPIDNTVTPGNDETGRARVQFTVPDLAGYDVGDIVTFDLVFGVEGFEQAVSFYLEVFGDGAVVTPPGDEPAQPAQPAQPKAPEPVGKPAGAGPDSLPRTGADAGLVAAGAAALTMLGGALYMLRRRLGVDA